jgi:hypothetical protein
VGGVNTTSGAIVAEEPNQTMSVGRLSLQIGNEAELKIRSECRTVSRVKMNVLAALNQFTLALGRPDTDRDQSVMLVTLMPRMEIDKAGGAAVKARDELASLGLDGGPASQIIPTIRGIRVTSKNELAPTTEAQPRGTAFTQNCGHSPWRTPLTLFKHLCRKGSMLRLERPPRRP